jgi:hypothetical protein
MKEISLLMFFFFHHDGERAREEEKFQLNCSSLIELKDD